MTFIKSTLFLFLTSLFYQTTFGQDFTLPDIIEKSKKSIVPIIGSDTKWSNQYRHLGTGILIGDRKLGKEYLLTCEHVIAIKDSTTGKTVRSVKTLYVNFNLYNDSIITVPLKLVYSDESNDFALLEYSFAGLPTPKDSLHRINLLIMPFDNFDNTQDLKEGEPLLYIGYPMSFGVGLKSYPVSRRGIVAQNIKESSTFLIDGFVQGGNSGSPVFRIKQSVYKFSGIAQAYPNEFGEIKYKNLKEPDRVAIVNPGFTIVKKIDVISAVLVSKFGFSK
ncbi:MAG TPA: serine protease [Chitinophagaceae bacterium]|nr:serine protease [Chitinophagaceae bacterium]